MHYMARPVSFRWDPEFVARIDAERGLVPRSAFVRAAVEAVLSGADGAVPETRADLAPVSSSEGVRSAAPSRSASARPNVVGSTGLARFSR